MSAQDLLNYINSLSAQPAVGSLSADIISLSAQIPDPKSVAKAWVTFDSTTLVPTLCASYNVASITRNSSGASMACTINFPNAGLTDNTYVVVGNARDGGFSEVGGANGNGPAVRTLSSVKIQVGNASTLFDTNVITVSIFGN